MADNKTPAEAVITSLELKFIELRKTLPKINKERHSDAVSYKFAKIDDVWRAITPAMNELRVNFCVSKEENATCNTVTTKTRNGEKLMFIYNADLTLLWTNADDPDDMELAYVHAIGWNDDPAKAKGAAHTYALKYYLFEKFNVDLGDDPDAADMSATGRTGNSNQGYRGGSAPQGTGGDYVYTWGKHQGMTVAQMEQQDATYNDWLLNKSNKTEPPLREAIVAYRNLMAMERGEERYPEGWPPEAQ